LLPFSSESSIFTPPTQKCKDENTTTALFFFVWESNVVSHPEGRTSLRTFQNRVLRRVIGSTKEEARGLRKLQVKELLKLDS
jgi:hypothetical protein